MTKEMVVEVINGLGRKGGSFCGFETLTHPKLNKKSRTSGLPFVGEFTIKATFSAMLGVNYENAVNNALERRGAERTFEAQKPFGKHYVGGSTWLMTDDKTESKFYIALDMVGGVKKTWLIDGREATAEEIEDLKTNYLPKPSAPKEGVTWRTYGVESIIAIH